MKKLTFARVLLAFASSVQLANCGGPPAHVARAGGMTLTPESQLQTLLVPNTAKAVWIDIGDAENINPRNKQDVGLRIALPARALAYHEFIPYMGRIYDYMMIDGDTVVVSSPQIGKPVAVGYGWADNPPVSL